MKTKNLVYIGVFSALICVGAFVKVPLGSVPFTLQMLFVILTGFLLDVKSGLMSIGIYLFLGLIGLPIFAKGGGFGYLFQPSFGYLIGFVFGIALISVLKNKMHPILAALIGMSAIYICGISYFVILQYVLYTKTFPIQFLLLNFWLIFVPSDLISMSIAYVVYKKLKNV